VLLTRLSQHQNAKTYGVTEAMITNAQFPERVLIECAKAAASEKTATTDRQLIIDGLGFVLAHIAGGPVVALLKAADQLRVSPTDEAQVVFELLVHHAEIHTQGIEAAMVEALDGLSTELAQRMLGALTATRTPQAIAILKPLLNSRNPALKCEAAALLSDSPDNLGKQLGSLLGSSDPMARAAAISTMLRHQVRSAGPWLIRAIESEGFKGRDTQEHGQVFDALYALTGNRAEAVLLRIVKNHGMLPDEKLDRMRMAASNTLGKYANSPSPIEALEDATRRRPWNTQALRIAAGAAVEAISARMRGEVPVEGGPGG
jgi:hypothetical protein